MTVAGNNASKREHNNAILWFAYGKDNKRHKLQLVIPLSLAQMQGKNWINCLNREHKERNICTFRTNNEPNFVCFH